MTVQQRGALTRSQLPQGVPALPPARSAAVRTLQRALVDAASLRYREGGRGRFAYHFARGKLGGDPMFIELLRQGAFPPLAEPGGRFLDLGSGQAVLASWLLAARARFDAGRWPAGWPEPPRVARLRALELMPADAARGQAAFAGEPRVRVERADIRQAGFGLADVVTILDVLHYLAPDAQDDVLRRARAALAPGGVLVMRVGDAAAGLPYRLSHWADQAITLVRGHGWSHLHGRTLDQWQAALHALGFEVRSVPTPGGLPFANTMLIAHT
ncbi:MAG: class I SAM-dependent methyltransferase [Ottowia sp.]|uniref:methyltransferase domain-containing protein n=1 Tax=Ottowia sp. TaxID=1898956 RepID=UPI0039E3BBC0